jgi:hypothetical protein
VERAYGVSGLHASLMCVVCSDGRELVWAVFGSTFFHINSAFSSRKQAENIANQRRRENGRARNGKAPAGKSSGLAIP